MLTIPFLITFLVAVLIVVVAFYGVDSVGAPAGIGWIIKLIILLVALVVVFGKYIPVG